MNQAYSRLSTTHVHITDCKFLVCMYWTRLVLVRPAASLYSASPLKHHCDTWNPIHLMGQVVILNDSDYQDTHICRYNFIYYTGRVADNHARETHQGEVILCGLSYHHFVYTVTGSKLPDQPSRSVTSNFNAAGYLCDLAEFLDKLPDAEDCNTYSRQPHNLRPFCDYHSLEARLVKPGHQVNHDTVTDEQR